MAWMTRRTAAFGSLFSSLRLAAVGGCLAAALGAVVHAAPVPDPLAVVEALVWTQNAGNVEANLAMFTDDATIATNRGMEFKGPEQRRRFVESTISTGFRLSVADAEVVGNRVTWRSQSASDFLVRLGIAPVTLLFVVVTDGSRVAYISNYYPLSELDRFDAACSGPAGHDMLIFNRPCAEYGRQARAHTEHLIATGVAKRE